MSVAPAPIYNPEPFNPTVYEQLNTDSFDYIVNSTLSNCSINDSNLTNCVLIGPIFSGAIKTKTLTLFNDNSLDTVSFTTEGNINDNNNVDIKFLPNAGSTANTALTIKNVNNVSHSFTIAGNASHNGNLSVGGNIELTGNNKSIQLNTSGSIYCGGEAVSVTEQEISYLSGVTSNIQNQLNNVTAEFVDIGTRTSSSTSVDTFWIPFVSGTDSRKLFIDNENYDTVSYNVNTNTLNCGLISTGGLETTGNVVITGANKTLQLSSTGGIYCGGAAVTVSQQEIAYLSGVTGNIQNQINNISGTYTAYSLNNADDIILPLGFKNHFVWIEGSSNAQNGRKVIFVEDWNVGNITYNFSTGAVTTNVQFVLKNPNNIAMYLINARNNAFISAVATVAGYSYFDFTLQGTSTRSVLISKLVSEINGLIQFS